MQRVIRKLKKGTQFSGSLCAIYTARFVITQVSLWANDELTFRPSSAHTKCAFCAKAARMCGSLGRWSRQVRDERRRRRRRRWPSHLMAAQVGDNPAHAAPVRSRWLWSRSGCHLLLPASLAVAKSQSQTNKNSEPDVRFKDRSSYHP